MIAFTEPTTRPPFATPYSVIQADTHALSAEARARILDGVLSRIADTQITRMRTAEGAELAEGAALEEEPTEESTEETEDDAPDGRTRCAFCGLETTALVRAACGSCA